MCTLLKVVANESVKEYYYVLVKIQTGRAFFNSCVLFGPTSSSNNQEKNLRLHMSCFGCESVDTDVQMTGNHGVAG